MQVDQLVAELLSRGDMNDDTVVELNRMMDDWRSGKLDPSDETYLRSLHARIFEAPMPDPEPVSAVPATLDGLDLEGWRDRALRAEAERDALLETTKTG